MSLTVGSLFAGIGGFDLGLERAGFTVKWQVEIDAWCQKVLTKHWPEVPKYGDIRDIDWAQIEPVDLVCGGFPCQPFSVAGKRQGANDARNMWPEYRRCLEALKPCWVLGENVPGVKPYLEAVVLPDLEALGYETAVLGIPACALGAPHRRERLWIAAWHPNGWKACTDHTQQGSEDVADHDQLRMEREGSQQQTTRFDECNRLHRWSTEPNVGRVAHGVPHRVDRLRGLGNAVVPQIVEHLGHLIQAVEQRG